jgi:hypothetical protein
MLPSGIAGTMTANGSGTAMVDDPKRCNGLGADIACSFADHRQFNKNRKNKKPFPLFA